MEKQVQRIKAEESLRQIAVDTTNVDKDGMRRILDSLTLEIGDTYQIVRPKFVSPDPDAKQKFNSIK